MKTFAAVSALVASAAAQSYFTVMSARSASPIHFLSLEARGDKFYLGGGPPSAYCPTEVGDACPSGNTTTLVGGDGGLSMGVIVPGGQRVYIDNSDGSMSYTVPHSSYTPPGAILDGWTKEENVGQSFGTLAHSSGLIACPPTTGATETGWQVFGQVANFTGGSGCLGFDALTINATAPDAWEY